MSINDSKPKRHKKNKNIVSFDEESVPKDVAKKLILQHREVSNNEDKGGNKQHKQTRKCKKNKEGNTTEPVLKNESEQVHDLEINSGKKKKEQKREKSVNETENEAVEETETPTLNDQQSKTENGESKRAMKRKKHEQLVTEKKIKSELASQQKCLNYLSQWKHNKNEWRFEKLRQVWLHQNMYEKSKIPNEFWDTLIEYFSSAKGKIRKTIVAEALKIVEKSGNSEETNTVEEENETNDQVKLYRARNTLQFLQE